MKEKTLPLSSKLIPGIIAIFLLLIYNVLKGDIAEFYPWLGETLLIYALWFFLLRVIVVATIERKYNTIFTTSILIGVFALFASMLILNMTVEDIVLRLLNATVIFSIIFTIFGAVKERID